MVPENISLTLVTQQPRMKTISISTLRDGSVCTKPNYFPLNIKNMHQSISLKYVSLVNGLDVEKVLHIANSILIHQIS